MTSPTMLLGVDAPAVSPIETATPISSTQAPIVRSVRGVDRFAGTVAIVVPFLADNWSPIGAGVSPRAGQQNAASV